MPKMIRRDEVTRLKVLPRGYKSYPFQQIRAIVLKAEHSVTFAHPFRLSVRPLRVR